MTTSSNNQVARILFKEIVPGDLRKIHAQSNDTPSGGGARDFRFGAFSRLQPAIAKMFPFLEQEERRRGGRREVIDVFKGHFCWNDSYGNVQTKESFFEPPTDARPSEGRIVRVHEYGCFDTSLMPHGGVGNRVLLLLIQLSDDSVWPYYAEERTLRAAGYWDPLVANVLLACLDAHRPVGHAAIGFKDFITGDCYCNGK
ncbi:hypothetical protein [Vibrio jasicida]|uniref:hypothetical protein n=1 Tax=Vibrio jasicida TaxID=766224 RepID=UPI0016403573|nr:hypothetical protein [Vibrio jasicida]